MIKIVISASGSYAIFLFDQWHHLGFPVKDHLGTAVTTGKGQQRHFTSVYKLGVSCHDNAAHKHKVSLNPSFIPNSYGFMPIGESLSRVCQGENTQYLSSVASLQEGYLQKMRVSALGSCVKIWYGLKYGILNTQKTPSQ